MNIDCNEILKVYSGLAGKCCCGCAGKYSYASQYQTIGGKERGYPVEDDQVNDKAIKRMVNKLSKNPLTVENDGVYILETATRLNMAYKLPWLRK